VPTNFKRLDQHPCKTVTQSKNEHLAATAHEWDTLPDGMLPTKEENQMGERKSLLARWSNLHDAVLKTVSIEFLGPSGNRMAISLMFHAIRKSGGWASVALAFQDVHRFAGRLPRGPSETVMFSSGLIGAKGSQSRFDSDIHSPKELPEGDSYFGFSFEGVLTELSELPMNNEELTG
jgi:hypothetical protein